MKPPKVTALSSSKKRTLSSRRWLLRQLNDPYVARAKECGYRSRAAFKLLDLDRKYRFLRLGQTVVDLGCAPGGWLQVLQSKVLKKPEGNREQTSAQNTGCVIGLDLQDVEPLEGVTLLKGDFTSPEIVDKLETLLRFAHPEAGQGLVDVVVSDMAAPACGLPKVDHIRIMSLVRDVAAFSQKVLRPGGCMVAKVLRGGTEPTLLADLKRQFTKVSHFKPASSRSESAEIYVVAKGKRGG